MTEGYRYWSGQLHAEGVALATLADRVGTPAYVYSAGLIEDAYRRFEAALAGLDATICYAVKANSNLAVIRTLAALGAGADVVSAGELARARAAGISPERIVFAGVGKTMPEMAAALSAGILQFNVESEAELEILSTIANRLGIRAPVALRINPDVDANTHAKITTGKRDNKFGIALDQAAALYDRARNLPGIEANGVAVHIGSQLTELAPYQAAFERLRALVVTLRASGHPIIRIDVGGGLGIVYKDETPPPIEAYARLVRQTLGDLGARLIFEPGRHLVAQAGILLARVLYVKEQHGRRFVILDAAMNDLLRPALYDAYHAIEPVAEPPSAAPIEPVDIVGPVCETGDSFAIDRPMPPLGAGDLVAIRSVGAYGAVMASTYNSRPLPPEIMVRDDRYAIVKPRRTVADLFADEILPDWLLETV